MRYASRFVLFASMAFAISGCGSSIQVRTMGAPEVGLTGLHAFRMLPFPARRDGRPATGADDPMINNSIANRAIREQIVKSFQDRGYALDERTPDFAIAFYASAREKLDVGEWDYGYPPMPPWPHYPRPVQAITKYTEGSVVIDVINPTTRELLWRGEGTAQLNDDPGENVKQLVKVANAIVGKFPSAQRRALAVAP